MHLREHEIKDISAELETHHPIQVLEWVNRTFQPHEVTMGTGFGAEGVALIDMLVSVNRKIPIFYLDTDVLFAETYRLRERLQIRFGIRFVRYASATSLEQQAAEYGHGLWERDPDLCCSIRKVAPLKAALKNRAAWITAIRRDQSASRANASIVERDERFGLLKINPLAFWTRTDVWDHILSRELPYNPLHDHGYPSIGCIHCTSPVRSGENERAGRWRGSQKTECGLHAAEVTVDREGVR